MAGLIIFMVVMVGISIVLRLLRETFKWVDNVAWAFVGIGVLMFIVGWINGSFWGGLFVGGIMIVVTMLMFGMGENKIERHGAECVLEDCPKCDYNKVEIIEDNDDYFITRCPRCGKKKLWVEYCEHCHSNDFSIVESDDYVTVICKRCGFVKQVEFDGK